MTGFDSKRQMAQDKVAEMLELCDYLEGNDASLEAQCKAAAFIREALAQPAQKPDRQELQANGTHPAPCARHCEAQAFKVEIRNLKAQLAQPAQNFCPRCGKRTADLTVIHTCTPPKGGHK